MYHFVILRLQTIQGVPVWEGLVSDGAWPDINMPED